MSMRNILVSCYLILFLAWYASAGYHPDRVHFVDSVTDASLFRGAAPVLNNTFVIDALRTDVQRVAKSEAGIAVPDDFHLIIVTMLSTVKPSEKTELSVEEAYAAANSNVSLVHWPIVGDVISPDTYPSSLCKSHAKDYDSSGDHMPSKVQQLRGLLTNTTASSSYRVVYFHCDAGMDRTGELYGDYQMTFGNQSYSTVLDFDNAIENPPRDINHVNQRALEWYCLYLLEAKGINRNCVHKC